MAAGHGLPTRGASSGSQEALNSMISQFQSKLKSNESVISSNKETISLLKDENSSLRRENSSLKEKLYSLENENEHIKRRNGKARSNQGDIGLNAKSMSPYPGGSHYLDNSKLSPASSTSDVSGNSGAGIFTSKTREHATFGAEILEGKLSHDPDVKKKFLDLTAFIGEKLAQLGDVQVRESNLKVQVEKWQVTARHILQFFVLLQGIVSNSGQESSPTIPAWLDMVLENESNQSIRHHICTMWRLLQWNIHRSLDNNRKLSAKSQVQIDEWFALQMGNLDAPNDMELTLANLWKSMSRDFGVVKEQVVEGLSMSISMEPEEDSSGISSSDSSLSSTIPAKDLWTSKSILQSLVEKIDDLYQKHTLLAKSNLVLDGLDEMERDMYLPQREALENYDLGNLLRLMSSVIQSLSQEVMSINAERGHCETCGQDINIEGRGDRSKDPDVHNQRIHGQPSGLVSAGQPSGLKSRESASQIPGNRFHPNPSGGAMPKVPFATRPVQGTFQGIHGPLPPRQLTVLQTKPHVRSKSDTSVSPHPRRVLDQSKLCKPSSLDSVLKPKSVALDISTSPSPVIYGRQSDLSDSDEEFQVRGPPDTPPEVRSIERMQIGRDSIQHPPELPGRIDRSGPFTKYAMQSASRPRDNTALFDGGLPMSQVYQCTGDNSSTTQDMLLPSSVQWSTVQLKDGGMASPTLEAMSQYNTAQQQRSQHQNYFSTIPQGTMNTYSDDIERDGFDTLTNIPSESSERKNREPCPVCKMTFPDYVPMQAVQSHINLHFDENHGSFELIKENYNSLNK